MLEIGACREQAAGLAQVGADRPVRRIALVVDHAALAAEPFPVRPILAVAFDREDGIDAMLLAQQEIVLAMVRRHMDEPGTGIGRNKIAGEEWARAGKEAAELV